MHAFTKLGEVHEDWIADLRARVIELAQQVDVFVPSLDELLEITGARGPVEALQDADAAGLRRVVLKAGDCGAYILNDGQITRVPALVTSVVDATGAGDTFCGGLTGGIARGLGLVEAVGLGAAVAGTAITISPPSELPLTGKAFGTPSSQAGVRLFETSEVVGGVAGGIRRGLTAPR